MEWIQCTQCNYIVRTTKTNVAIKYPSLYLRNVRGYNVFDVDAAAARQGFCFT